MKTECTSVDLKLIYKYSVHVFTKRTSVHSNKNQHQIEEPAMTSTHYQPHWVREDFIDFVLEKFDPLRSLKKVKAKVVKQEALSPDMFKITLLPNDKFSRAWQAGQSVLVTVKHEGVYHQRHYSIVDIDSNGSIILGIKVQGKVSQQLCYGKDLYVELSQAQGEFTLHQDKTPALLIASGSGITAIYAMLKQALAQNLQQVYLLYFNRHPVFHVELTQLLAQYPQLQYQFIDTTQQHTHFDETLLAEFCPSWKQLPSYVCGSSGLMHAVKDLYQTRECQQNLHSEYFQPVQVEGVIEQVVTFRRAQRDFIADKSLLESAEQAGLKPTHGCRMGICSTCTCHKVSGITKNMLTGEIESEDHRPIKLCISQALSPVVIDL